MGNPEEQWRTFGSGLSNIYLSASSNEEEAFMPSRDIRCKGLMPVLELTSARQIGQCPAKEHHSRNRDWLLGNALHSAFFFVSL